MIQQGMNFFVLGALMLVHSISASLPELSLVPEDTLVYSKGVYDTLSQRASSESFISYLTGTDCYTRALHDMRKECKSMGDEDRSRLAVALASCLLVRSGRVPIPCRPHMSVKECTQGMDDRAFATYTTFFSNIHSICIFLQNADFQQQTEALVNALHHSSRSALNGILEVQAGLSAQSGTLAGISTQVTGVSAAQARLAERVEEAQVKLQSLDGHALHLQHLMNTSLNNEVELHAQQTLAIQGVRELRQLEEERAQDALNRWEVLNSRAVLLEERQQTYEELQAQLLYASQSLADHTAYLESGVQTVLRYQQASSAVLSQLVGGSSFSSSLSYYGCILCMALLLSSSWFSFSAPSARSTLLLLVTGGIVLEIWIRSGLLPQQMDERRSIVAYFIGMIGGVQAPVYAVRTLAVVAMIWIWSRHVQRKHSSDRDPQLQALLQRLEDDLQVLQQITHALRAPDNPSVPIPSAAIQFRPAAAHNLPDNPRYQHADYAQEQQQYSEDPARAAMQHGYTGMSPGPTAVWSVLPRFQGRRMESHETMRCGRLASSMDGYETYFSGAAACAATDRNSEQVIVSDHSTLIRNKGSYSRGSLASASYIAITNGAQCTANDTRYPGPVMTNDTGRGGTNWPSGDLPSAPNAGITNGYGRVKNEFDDLVVDVKHRTRDQARERVKWADLEGAGCVKREVVDYEAATKDVESGKDNGRGGGGTGSCLMEGSALSPPSQWGDPQDEVLATHGDDGRVGHKRKRSTAGGHVEEEPAAQICRNQV